MVCLPARGEEDDEHKGEKARAGRRGINGPLFSRETACRVQDRRRHCDSARSWPENTVLGRILLKRNGVPINVSLARPVPNKGLMISLDGLRGGASGRRDVEVAEVSCRRQSACPYPLRALLVVLHFVRPRGRGVSNKVAPRSQVIEPATAPQCHPLALKRETRPARRPTRSVPFWGAGRNVLTPARPRLLNAAVTPNDTHASLRPGDTHAGGCFMERTRKGYGRVPTL